jgi:hypothetical protein
VRGGAGARQRVYVFSQKAGPDGRPVPFSQQVHVVTLREAVDGTAVPHLADPKRSGHVGEPLARFHVDLEAAATTGGFDASRLLGA